MRFGHRYWVREDYHLTVRSPSLEVPAQPVSLTKPLPYRLTVADFWERNRDAQGRAALGPKSWIEQRGAIYRLRTPEEGRILDASEMIGKRQRTADRAGTLATDSPVDHHDDDEDDWDDDTESGEEASDDDGYPAPGDDDAEPGDYEDSVGDSEDPEIGDDPDDELP
jgi:hypothetical protein